MKVAQVVLVVLHLLGVVALLAGLLVQVRHPEKRITGPMRDGIGTTFLAGLQLVGVLEARDQDFDHTTVSLIFAIGLVSLVLVMSNLRKPSIARWLYWFVLAHTVMPTLVAFAFRA